MSNTKYGENFITDVVIDGKFGPRLSFAGSQLPEDKPMTVKWNYIAGEYIMVETPHAHDFDQYLHFFAADSSNINEFDAIVELSLGEEGEKHIITKPTVVYVPKGLIHCPLNYKVINKPIIFMNVAMTAHYQKS